MAWSVPCGSLWTHSSLFRKLRRVKADMLLFAVYFNSSVVAHLRPVFPVASASWVTLGVCLGGGEDICV